MEHDYIREVHESILFEEEAHTYLFEGEYLTSGTTFLGQFHEPFNRNKVLDKKTSCPYERTNIKIDWEISSPRGTAIHEHLETIAKELKTTMIDRYDQVKHKIKVEYRDQVEKGCILVDSYLSRGNYEIVGTEVRITNGKIAGTIDLLLYNLDTNKYLLLDYKTCVSLTKAHYGKMFYEPFDDITCSKHDKYSMQLSLYSAILEDCYDVEVEDMQLLWIPLEGKELLMQCDDYRDVVRRAL